MRDILYFFLFLVVEWLLYTTTSNGLCCLLCFVFWAGFGLQAGCASCHKQRTTKIVVNFFLNPLFKEKNQALREGLLSSHDKDGGGGTHISPAMLSNFVIKHY